MAETLAVLIKLAARKVEEVEQELARTRRAIESTDISMEEKEKEKQEAFLKAVGEDDLITMQATTAYQERLRREIEQLKEVKRALEDRMEELRGLLKERFIEQKRYELLQERQKIAAKKKHAKKVQDNLDDLGQQR